MATKTALTRRPSKPQVSIAVPKPQRLSPGVYRGAGGELTNSAGIPLRGGPRRPTMTPDQRTAIDAAIGGAGNLPMPTTPPGGVAQGIGAGLGAAIGAGMDKGPNTRFIQPYPGPLQGGGFAPGQDTGDYRRFADGFGQGLGGFGKGPAFNTPESYGPPSPELADMARSRAEAINRGDMVTMDYNPQREALVDQYLNEMRGGQTYAPGSPDMTRTGIANPSPFGGNLYDMYQQQRLQQDAMSGALGAANMAQGGIGMGIGAPAPMAPPTQSVTGGMAQGIAAGLGGAPVKRPMAPNRPMGDGRDRRFAQPQVRPPAPLPPGTPMGPIPTPQRPRGIQGVLRRGR